MSAIRPEDFLRYFEDAHSIRFMDTATGRPALDIPMKEKGSQHNRRTMTSGLNSRTKRPGSNKKWESSDESD